MGHADCEICVTLPDEVHTEDAPGQPPLRELFPAYGRLEIVIGHDPFDWLKLQRCPLCGTYYRYEYDQDRDHWIPGTWEALRRVISEEAHQMM